MSIDKQRKIGTIIFVGIFLIIVAFALADSIVQQEIRDWATYWQGEIESYFADKTIIKEFPFLVTVTPTPTSIPTPTPTPTITPIPAPTHIASSPEEAAAIAIDAIAPDLIDVLDIHWWEFPGEDIQPMLTIWFLAKDMGPDPLWTKVHKEIQIQLQQLSNQSNRDHVFGLIIAEKVGSEILTFYWAICDYESYMTVDVSKESANCYTDGVVLPVPEENLRFMDN